MEIFRSDSGGNHLSERLLDVVNEVRKIDKYVLEGVDVINDHKGILKIHLSKDFNSILNNNYILSVFYIVWSRMGENNVVLHCFNGIDEPIVKELS